MNIGDLKKIAARFDQVSILIVGDVMLDQFVETRVARISPEAPVPVAEVLRETFKPGGAANVINNITALGGKVVPVGIIGKDDDGTRLLELLRSEVDASDSCILIDPDRATTVKTRIMCDGHQIVRVDRERTTPLSLQQTEKVVDFVLKRASGVDGFVISDYDKGVVTSRLLEGILPLAKNHGKPVVVDPKTDHFLDYKGAKVVVPNLKEASEGTGIRYVNETSVINMGQWILTHLDCDAVLITRGKDGMSLFEKEGMVTQIPTLAREVYDVTGAGDTVTSVVSMALATGAPILRAALLANCAASIVVSKVGTAALTREELLCRIDEMKDEILQAHTLSYG
ncbi:MAG: D-glycero-beta-D-manno-heptose-7-phosphate kinase [Candidatus Thorarchaeota archaeon SMTZ1-83]|nr:MAG: hypothetical protein AM324_03085 [Candidatus Thorarchaeota archaeon SMTZ1-83]